MGQHLTHRWFTYCMKKYWILSNSLQLFQTLLFGHNSWNSQKPVPTGYLMSREVHWNDYQFRQNNYFSLFSEDFQFNSRFQWFSIQLLIENLRNDWSFYSLSETLIQLLLITCYQFLSVFRFPNDLILLLQKLSFDSYFILYQNKYSFLANILSHLNILRLNWNVL